MPTSLYPVTLKVELLLNGTWTDISQYVYQRDVTVITGGQADEASSLQPATCNLTLNNRDGRFSPNYSAGAYFPYLQRNTQIRISATATSTTGNFYSGYRFWGEVSTWPPMSDPTGNDIFVQINPSGPLRRINQGGGVGSALTRYYATLTGSQAPIAYWPCEEDPDTDQVQAGISGGQNMAITTGTPTWKAVKSFNGSAPIGVLNNSTWDGLTGSFSASGDDIFTAPGTHQWQATTSTVNAKCWAAGGGGSGDSTGAGAGGEFAQETALAVTIGNFYTLTVGAGGVGMAASNGGNGGDSIFPGDSVTVHAHGGQGGQFAVGNNAAGGTGSTNTVHHDGGQGGSGQADTDAGGAGGGSSGGPSARGNPGTNITTPATGAAGGFAPPVGVALSNSNNSPSGSTFASTVTRATATGDAILVSVTLNANPTTVTVSSVTDSKSNSYSLVQSENAGTGFNVYQFIALNTTALTTSDTITINFSAANTGPVNVIALDCGGVVTASATDKTATGGGGDPQSISSGTLSQAAEIAVGSWTVIPALRSPVLDDSVFTNVQVVSNPGNAPLGVFVAYLNATASVTNTVLPPGLGPPAAYGALVTLKCTTSPVGQGGPGGAGGTWTSCVDAPTEILTRRGWLSYDELETGDEAMSVNLDTGQREWAAVTAVNVHPGSWRMTLVTGRGLSVCANSEHRWLVRAGDEWCYRLTGELQPDDLIPLEDGYARFGDCAIATTEISGIIWCPTTGNGNWLARRNGAVYFIGNKPS